MEQATQQPITRNGGRQGSVEYKRAGRRRYHRLRRQFPIQLLGS